MKRLTLGSLFDGSGGFPLGGLISGITPVWSSEIEPFCIRVTSKRLPWVKHYGNVSEINGGEIEPVDIITFGSPCKSIFTLYFFVKGVHLPLNYDKGCYPPFNPNIHHKYSITGYVNLQVRI